MVEVQQRTVFESVRKSYKNQYSLIKIMAITLVVIGHVSTMYSPYGILKPKVSSDFLYALTGFIYSFHMPLFVALSGMIFGVCINSKAEYDFFWPTAWKKFKRLIIPYFAFGFLYVAPVMVNLSLTDMGYFEYCKEGIFYALNSRHLWYLPTLFNISIGALAVHRAVVFVKKYFSSFYNAVCQNIFAKILVPIVLVVLFGRLAYIAPTTSKMFSLRDTLSYAVFFYIGFIVNAYIDNINRFLYRFKWLLLAVAAVPLFLYKYENDNFYISMICAVCGIIVFVGITDIMCAHPLRFTKFLTLINRNEYGMYLFHPMIIYVFFYFFGDKSINPVLLSMGIFIATYVVSIVLTKLLRACRLQFLMGEK